MIGPDKQTSILSELTPQLTYDAPKTILFIGERSCGGRSLARNLCTGLQTSKPTDDEGLWFDYIQDRQLDDETVQLYSMTNDTNLGDLLEKLIRPDTVKNMVIVLCIDWNKPWRFMSALEEMIYLIECRLETINEDTPELINALKQDCIFTLTSRKIHSILSRSRWG
jgi:hypothetical protein